MIHVACCAHTLNHLAVTVLQSVRFLFRLCCLAVHASSTTILDARRLKARRVRTCGRYVVHAHVARHSGAVTFRCCLGLWHHVCQLRHPRPPTGFAAQRSVKAADRHHPYALQPRCHDVEAALQHLWMYSGAEAIALKARTGHMSGQLLM
jgi:hypothetical protein